MAIPGATELKSGSALFESAFATSNRHGNADGPVVALALALQRLDSSQRRLRRQFGALLGLSASEFNALFLISQVHQLTPKQLAAELGLTNGAVTAMTDRLDSNDWIRRVPNPSDRRSLYLEVAPKGLKAVKDIAALYLDLVQDMIATSEGVTSTDHLRRIDESAEILFDASQRLEDAAAAERSAG